MDNSLKELAADMVLALLDIMVILQIEENPLIGIALVALLKTVTRDHSIRISLILLVLVLGLSRNHSS
ncbi:hypothetical protein AABM38_09600 [Heyndrickxia sp. MSNUG]|uniref:hypothetical protein n=1 Tax=Heyndrickxia sp. MSNUG TaxID=3136677 RepID=UPI003C30BAFD